LPAASKISPARLPRLFRRFVEQLGRRGNDDTRRVRQLTGQYGHATAFLPFAVDESR
jgi:hypothetical protein